MKTIPNHFLKYNRISTTYKLYDNVSSLLNCKKHQIQIYYKDIKIPYSKSNLNEIEIPKIGYEYGDCFKFQKLQDKIPPLIEIMYNKNKKKTLKLSNTTLSKNIEKSNIIYIVSKLLHTSSRNINFLEDQNIFSLKKGSLYEIDFIDFNKYSRETEYYCFDESRNLMDLQTFVANIHGLHSNQIKYVEYENNKDQNRVLNSFPSEKIFCFTTSESKGSSEDSDSNNKAYELSVDVSIDGDTVNFKLPFNSKIKDLRKKITEHNEKSYFGIYIEKEFVSDEKRITRFLIEPNKVNKVYTICPEEQKRCGLFLFQNTEKNLNNKKDISYLMNLNMKCGEVQQFFFKKNYSKEFIDADGNVIDSNRTLESITSKNESMRVIKYQNSQTKYFYKIEEEEEIKCVEITPTKRIIDFLNQIDEINKMQLKNNEYIVANYQGTIAPFWGILLLYPTTEDICFQIKKYKEDKVRAYKIVNDKLEKCESIFQTKDRLYSSFIEVPKNQIHLYYPFRSCFTIREKKSRPMIITFVRSPCLQYEYRIINKEDKKKSTAFEQIERFGLLDDNFQLKFRNGIEEYIIPPNFSIKSLPSKAEIQIEAETDKNCYAQLFYYDNPKKGHFISYDKETTIKQVKEMLQKEFDLYEYPSNAISFYFYENRIKEINGEHQILKDFFISNCINPKTLIKVKINEMISGLKNVQIKIRKKEHNYIFRKNDKIEDVRKRLENQYQVQISRIKEKGTNKNLIDSDEIPDSLRIMFKTTKIMISESPNGKKIEKIMKAGAAIKSLIKNTKIAENYTYKFNPKYQYKIFVPRTSMYIHNKQTLTQLPQYEIFRYFTVKLKCDYLEKYQVNKLYSENLTVSDVYKDLRPLVKNDQYQLLLIDITKKNFNKKLGQMMENKKEIEAKIIPINKNRRKSISNKSFGLVDFESISNADSNESEQNHSNEEVLTTRDVNLDNKDSNDEESLNKEDSNDSESDKPKTDKSESDTIKPNKNRSMRPVSRRKYMPKVVREYKSDDSDSDNKSKLTKKKSEKSDSEKSDSEKSDSEKSNSDEGDSDKSNSDKSDSDKSDSDKSDSNENSNSDQSSSDEPKPSPRSSKKPPKVTSNSTESESEGSDSDNIKEKNKKLKDKKKLSDKKSKNNKKTVKSDSDNSSNSDDSDDDNDEDEEVEKKYNFLFSKNNIISLPLPKGSTISDAKKKIAEYLNDNKENEDEDDVDPSTVDIVFSGKSLKKKTKLESMKLDENEVLNVYVQKVEDILLMTAKALRFTREDLDKDDDDEYEYVYDEEEEEEDDDDDE